MKMGKKIGNTQRPTTWPAHGGSHNGVQVCVGDMGEKGKQNSLGSVTRDESGDVSMERSSVMYIPALPPDAMMKCQPMLPLRAVYGPVRMQKQGSVSMSVAQTTTKGHADGSGMDSCLGPCPCPRAVQSWPCPSPVTALRRAGPVPHLDSTVELPLVS